MADKRQFGCPCCQKLLKMPVQSTNGHRFCEGCFKQRTPTVRCPLCEEDDISSHNDCFQLGENHIRRSCKGPCCVIL